MKKQRKNNNRIIGSVLLYLLVVVVFVIPPTFSSYVSTVSGGDTATVALVDVSVTTTQGNTLDVNGETREERIYNFNIVSNSEVALTYDIVVTLTEALQDGMTMTLKKEGSETPSTSNSDTSYTFAGVGTFPATGGTHSYQLVFTLAADKPFSDQTNNVTIKLNATQID